LFALVPFAIVSRIPEAKRGNTLRLFYFAVNCPNLVQLRCIFQALFLDRIQPGLGLGFCGGWVAGFQEV
jgi:hypothetical protein